MADDAPKGTDGGDAGFKAIASQADLDRIVGERVARERGKFADYDDLKAKAAKFDAADEASKSEVQKASDRAAKAEAETAKIPAKVAEALKAHLVTLGVVSKEDEVLLTAADPDALLAQVKRLSERATDRKKSGNFSPREGSTTTQTKAEPLREFTRGLFGREE